MIHDGGYPAAHPLISGSASHAQHHIHFNYNFEPIFTVFDRLGGTYMEPDRDVVDSQGKYRETSHWDGHATGGCRGKRRLLCEKKDNWDIETYLGLNCNCRSFTIVRHNLLSLYCVSWTLWRSGADQPQDLTDFTDLPCAPRVPILDSILPTWVHMSQ